MPRTAAWNVFKYASPWIPRRLQWFYSGALFLIQPACFLHMVTKISLFYDFFLLWASRMHLFRRLCYDHVYGKVFMCSHCTVFHPSEKRAFSDDPESSANALYVSVFPSHLRLERWPALTHVTSSVTCPGKHAPPTPGVMRGCCGPLLQGGMFIEICDFI